MAYNPWGLPGSPDVPGEDYETPMLDDVYDEIDDNYQTPRRPQIPPVPPRSIPTTEPNFDTTPSPRSMYNGVSSASRHPSSPVPEPNPLTDEPAEDEYEMIADDYQSLEQAPQDPGLRLLLEREMQLTELLRQQQELLLHTQSQAMAAPPVHPSAPPSVPLSAPMSAPPSPSQSSAPEAQPPYKQTQQSLSAIKAQRIAAAAQRKALKGTSGSILTDALKIQMEDRKKQNEVQKALAQKVAKQQADAHLAATRQASEAAAQRAAAHRAAQESAAQLAAIQAAQKAAAHQSAAEAQYVKDLARQKKLEALRTAELNQQKKQMERAIAARAASEQAHGRGRKLSTEESGNYYNGGSQQIHTADVYSSIHKPKKTAQQPAQPITQVQHTAPPAIKPQTLYQMRLANRTTKRNFNIGGQVTWQMNAITSGALTRADPKLMFRGKDKLPKRDRKSYRQNRTNVYITRECLQPLPLLSDYEDLAGSEAVKLVTERGTDADDGGAFERANILPNVLRKDDVIKRNIHRTDKPIINGKLVPIRPKRIWTRNACVSVQSLLGDNGQNLYVRLTDDVYEDEYEMGMVFLLEEPPVSSLLEYISGTVQPLDVRKCHVVPVKQNLYMPITIERDMKGVVGYSPKTDATASHIKKGKAKRRTILPTKHTQPVLSYSLIPIYRHGHIPKVTRRMVKGQLVEIIKNWAKIGVRDVRRNKT